MTRQRTNGRSTRMRGVTVTFVLVVAGFTIIGAGQKLPSAESIMDKFVEATGGKKAYDAVKNRVSVFTLDIAAQGITLEVTSYSAKPAESYTLVESPAFGKIEEGTHDGVAWEKSIMMGTSVKTGKERDDALREATFDRFAYWRGVYTNVTCIGSQVLDDTNCYKVVAGADSSDADTLYYEVKSGLLRRVTSTVTTAMGDIPVRATFSDYRAIDGVLQPFGMGMEMVGQVRTMTVKEVRQNVEMPLDRFELPADVKELLEDGTEEG